MELHEETAKLAYEIWEKRGRQPGGEWENWHEAEIIISARCEKALEAENKTGGETIKAEESNTQVPL